MCQHEVKHLDIALHNRYYESTLNQLFFENKQLSLRVIIELSRTWLSKIGLSLWGIRQLCGGGIYQILTHVCTCLPIHNASLMLFLRIKLHDLIWQHRATCSFIPFLKNGLPQCSLLTLLGGLKAYRGTWLHPSLSHCFLSCPTENKKSLF